MALNQTPESPTGHGRSADAEDTSRFPALGRWFLWADDPASVQRLILGLAGLCGLLFVVDLFIHRHTEVPGEGFPGYYAIVGFIAFTLIVLGAKQLRVLIRRDESFYAPDGVDAERYPEAGTERRSIDGTSDDPADGEAGNASGSVSVDGSGPASAGSADGASGDAPGGRH